MQTFVDCDALDAAAGKLVTLAIDANDHGRATVQAWRRAQPFYSAPEASVLVAALDPVEPRVLHVSQRLSTAYLALAEYAKTAGPVIDALRPLLARVGPLPAEARAEVQRLQAELLAAEQRCVRRLRDTSDAPLFTAAPTGGFKVQEHADKNTVLVTAGPVKVGGNNGFTVTRNSDGTVSVAISDARELAATLGLGGSVDIGANGEGKVEIGPGLTLSVGDTWNLRPEEKPEDLVAQIQLYAQRERQRLSPDEGFGVAVADVIDPIPLRPADVVAAEGGFSVKGTVKLTEKVPGAVGGGLNGEVAFTEKVGTTRDTSNGSTTTDTTVEASLAETATLDGRAGSAAVQGSLEGKGTLTAQTSVKHDSTGRLTQLVLTTTHEGGATVGGEGTLTGGKAPGLEDTGKAKPSGAFSHVRTTTTTLDVDDHNRELVEQWLTDGGSSPQKILSSPEAFRPDRAVPGDTFQQELFTNARVQDVDHDKYVSKKGIDEQVKGGVLSGGFEASGEGTELHATGADYLDRPGADGVRGPVALPLDYGKK